MQSMRQHKLQVLYGGLLLLYKVFSQIWPLLYMNIAHYQLFVTLFFNILKVF